MTYHTESITVRLARARAWRIANKPFFDELYGPEPAIRRAHSQTGFKAVTTEPRRWREANKAYFDALYGVPA